MKMNFDENALKRFIRVLNTVVNLYDIENIPIEIVEIMCKPVWNIANVLKIPVKMKVDGDQEVIDKFVMPENFERWLETRGEIQT
jgi:hypothetical protein